MQAVGEARRSNPAKGTLADKPPVAPDSRCCIRVRAVAVIFSVAGCWSMFYWRHLPPPTFHLHTLHGQVFGLACGGWVACFFAGLILDEFELDSVRIEDVHMSARVVGVV